MIDINSISWDSSPADINEAVKLISQRGESLDDYPKIKEVIQYIFEEHDLNYQQNSDAVGKILSSLTMATAKEFLLLKQVEKLSQEFKNEKNLYRLIEIADELIKIRNDGHKLNLDYSVEGFLNKLEDTRKEIEKEDLTEREMEIELVIRMEREINEPEILLDNKLNYLKIKDLVEAYDKAVDEREKGRLLEEIARREKVEINEVMRMIRRQLEIARELKNLETQNLEKLNDKKEILKIARAEKITTEAAKAVLDEAKIIQSKIRVDNFVEAIIVDSGELNNQILIRIEIAKVISGEKGKLELPSNINSISAKKIDIKTREFINKNPKTVRQYQLDQINEEIDILKNESASKEELREIERVREILIKFHNVSSPDVRTNKSRNEAQLKLEKDNKISIGKSNVMLNKVQAVLDSAYQSPQKFSETINKINKLSNFGKKILAGTKLGAGIEEISIKIAGNPITSKTVLAMQRIANAKVKLIELGMKIPGINKLLVGTSDLIGGAAMVTFIEGSNIIMAEKGIITGAISIFKLIATGAGALEGAAGVEGITAASATLAAWQGVPVLGQVILVVALIITIIYVSFKIYDKAADWIKNITKINFLWGVRDTFIKLFGNNWFGKGSGVLAQLMFNGAVFGGALIINAIGFFFGTLMVAGLGAMAAIATPVIISFVVGTMVYNLFFLGPMVSSLVPPPPQALGGSCQPKEDVGEPPVTDGEVNCNQNAPEGSASISKEEFVKKANAWRLGGRNYASECYNDVVNRAKCAGVNPDYALAVWLHESGASNYGIANVEDFGIHGQASAPPKNFDKQITKFLSLKLGQFCPGLEYWLSFSTNFLTGTCDAERAMICQNPSLCGGKSSEEMNIMVAGGILKLGVDVQNGTSYRSVFVDTFRLMNIAVPASATIPKGGQNCGGSSSNTAVAEGENEFVAADGTVMVCSGPVDSEGNFIGIPGESAYDPNAPGLEGELIPGASCSVAHLVVDTKQCGQSWSNKALPGGSGTICSAGCGPSSASSILRNKNGSMTPDTVIFEPGSAYGSMNFNGSSLGQADTTLKKHGYTTSGVQDCTQTDIANWIREGKAVVLLSHSDTGNGSTIGHILVAVAIDSSGKIFTKDPYYSNNTPFSTKGEGNIKTLRSCLPVQLGNKCQGQIKSQ